LKTEAEEKIFAFLRKNGDAEVLVLLNFSGGEPVRFHVQDYPLGAHYTELFTDAKKKVDGYTEFVLEPWSWQVWVK